MQSPDSTNELFHLAAGYVNHTGSDIFLTGKAGTGKTTFLRFIRNHSFKKSVVVAPTGVAAINAGGMTIHSFFQLPFGSFVPEKRFSSDGNANLVDRHTLLGNIRFNAERRELIKELELLIIDEVSMLRADLLDAMDEVLRSVRRKYSVPFGGVQVLYIGDLFQLPPVVKQNEWRYLSEFYESPFFFHARVLKESQPVYLELKKIYRQSEGKFISILNNIRNNIATQDDLDELHKKYNPDFEPHASENFITLTTHNSKADEINSTRLRNLEGTQYVFKGKIENEFNENALPVEKDLTLKVGAQIMFIKNDSGETRRYYNGKLATVKKIIPANANGEGEKILVAFPNEKDELELKKDKWENVRYSFNREKDSVDENVLGTYTQYPVRLAWAVTIHKSQGLTFEKAIIDAGDSFAAGQVYVALSRLTGIEGLVLYSRITPQAISTDERVVEFAGSEMSETILKQKLFAEQKLFACESMMRFFDWKKLSEKFHDFQDELLHRSIPDKEAAAIFSQQMIEKVSEQEKVAAKFSEQMDLILNGNSSPDFSFLHQRTAAASAFFMNAMEEIISSIKNHADKMKVKKRVKTYLTSLSDLLYACERKKIQLTQATKYSEALMKGIDEESFRVLNEEQKNVLIQVEEFRESKSAKPKKGDSNKMSLQLFREGKSVQEIAKIRELAASTVESHLAAFILTGEIDVHEILSPQKVITILKAIEETEGAGSSAVRNALGENYSYSDIRAVQNYRRRMHRS